AGTAIAAVAATYGGAYAKADWGPIHEGIGDPEFRGAVDFINRTAAPGARLIFRKPRLLALLTDRAAGIYPTEESTEQIRRYIHEARIGYVMVGTPPDEAFDIDRTVLARVMAAYPDDW